MSTKFVEVTTTRETEIMSRSVEIATDVCLSFVHLDRFNHLVIGIIGRTSPGMRQVVGFGDRSTGRGTFRGEFGARHCNQWGLYAMRPSSQITLDRLVIIVFKTHRK